MFELEEIEKIIKDDLFISDFNWVQQSLVNTTIRHSNTFENETCERLDYFLECVSSSCADWEEFRRNKLCVIAAEIGEVLSNNPLLTEGEKRRKRVRSALLYDFAGMPSLAASVLDDGDYGPFLSRFFTRNEEFQKLNLNGEELKIESNSQDNINHAVEKILEQDALNLVNYQQGYSESPKKIYSSFTKRLLSHVPLDISAADSDLLAVLMNQRMLSSTKSNVEQNLFEILKQIQFPVELWPAQINALNNGLLKTDYDSWGLAAPTGTGKTFLTRLLIANALRLEPDSKILYIVPSRALVYEISSSLSRALENIGIEVLMINPLLSDLDETEQEEISGASVIVMTPEKADLLVRIGKSNLEDVSNVIIDEAHHIESDTRGVLLELYLWRIKKLITRPYRFIFLSAVAPNIGDLTSWAGLNPRSNIFHDRPTRMRAGVYKILDSSGWIEFANETKVHLIEKVDQSSKRMTLVQLAEEIHTKGPVLIVAKGKKECESLAESMIKRQSQNGTLGNLAEAQLISEEYLRLDSRLEREMYQSVPLRSFIQNRVAYHHAGLPPRVRRALEDLIRKGYIDFVFATTTLAEGVNFPFSTVIVQSLALREPPQKGVSQAVYKPITPRSFWNIAGRAGRPGFDKEGQVILFEPTLGLDKIDAVLGSYLNPNLKDIEPVKSGLFNGIKLLYESSKNQQLNLKDLEKIELDEHIPKQIKGTVNLIRVGLVHATATEIFSTPEEIVEGSFARSFLTDEEIDFSRNLVRTQAQIIDDFFSSDGAPSEKIVAEMGLSLDTISRLKEFVQRLQDWQINSYSRLFYGSTINLEQAKYTIAPVAKRMAELEGPKLGGFLSDLAINWLSGVPLTVVKNKTSNFANQSLEDLISVIFSRIQYLLPWGLYAVDSILEEEAEKRKLLYNNEVKRLSYLVDSGVPNFDAFRLTKLEIERVDATRLSSGYYSRGGLQLGVDIIGWLANLEIDDLNRIVRGIDNRRIDYDLVGIVDSLG